MSNSIARPIAPSPSKSTEPTSQSFFSQRSRRQLGLFWAGAGFFAISSIITRRSLVRRYKATIPAFYQPNNRLNEVNGAMEALDALNIATINVLSISMMLGGGLLYAFDISSLDDLRRNVRSKIGADATRSDQEVEKEIEDWVASFLEKNGMKESIKKSEDHIQSKKDAAEEGKR